jgi:hypothetical protein
VGQVNDEQVAPTSAVTQGANHRANFDSHFAGDTGGGASLLKVRLKRLAEGTVKLIGIGYQMQAKYPAGFPLGNDQSLIERCLPVRLAA